MSRHTCLVVMYHYVRDSAATAYPAIRALAPALFEQQLDWLQREYRVVGGDDLDAALDGGPPLPPNAALLTFDDGFVDHFEAAYPLLASRGLTGTFFISHDSCGEAPRLLGVHATHFLLAKLGAAAFGRAVLAECQLAPAPTNGGRRGVFGLDHWEDGDDRAVKHLLNYELPFTEADRVLDTLFRRHVGDPAAFARRLYLDERMVRDMARGGMTFGYHTRSHRMLSRLDVAAQADELRGGVEWIRSLTGQRRVPFCYPWGGVKTYTRDTIRILRAAGFSLAFNTVRRRVALETDDRFELPRFDTRDLPPYTRGEQDAIAAAGPVEEA